MHMKFKSIMLLAVAAGCGLVAMFGVQQALSGRKAPDPEANLAKVYVAAEEIPSGTILNETLLKIEKWPKDAVPKGAIIDLKQIHERALVVKAFPGDLILEAKLGEPGRSGASVSIPKGMRVVTVPVNLTTAHSGLMQPNDRVDVVVTYKVKDEKRGQIQKTKTVLEYIQVFATDTKRDAESNGGSEESAKGGVKNISLLVTPEQSGLLMLAEKMGTLQLALRNLDDHEQGQGIAIDESSFDTEGTGRGVDNEEHTAAARLPNRESSLKDFLEQQAAPEPEAVKAPPTVKTFWTITIFDKGKSRQEQIDLSPESRESATVIPVPGGNNQEMSEPVEKGRQAARKV
jgi:pilus assembly protein CpaB